MEDEINGDVPCSSLAVDSIIRVGTAGSIWGVCIGSYDADKVGLTGISRASFVAKSVGKFSFQCGTLNVNLICSSKYIAVFAGVFSITRCGMQRYRRQNDWVNTSFAGALAGAAVTARTGNWRQVLGMAVVVSIFSSTADYYKKI